MIHHHMVDREGSGHLTVTLGGKMNTEYNLRNEASATAAQARAHLEREMFQSCCEDPQLDYKPRENLRKHFCQFNAPADHGPIAKPPFRVTSNPEYQANLAKGNATV